LPSTDAQVRVDAGVVEGGEVSMFYDPMIAKIIAWNKTRTGALAALADALETAEVAGVRTNLAFLVSTLRHKAMIEGEIDTGFIERHKDQLIGVPKDAIDDAFLVAVVHLLLERRTASSASSPWGSLDGWRLGGMRQEETVRLSYGSSERVVSVTYRETGWLIGMAEHRREVTAQFAADGSVAVVSDGRKIAARVLRLGGDLVVLMRGRSFTLSPHDPLETAEHSHGSGADIRAPMPGKIIQMLAKTGDHVRRGQALAVMEAMKMEHTLTAPGDLVVKLVPYRAGDQVAEGAVIVGFEVVA
jgi:3-methylcrotonyl-CoA carboxylase alpha subunit